MVQTAGPAGRIMILRLSHWEWSWHWAFFQQFGHRRRRAVFSLGQARQPSQRAAENERVWSCIGHVINLVVKAFLYGYEFVEETGVEIEEDALLEASLSTWRNEGHMERFEM